MVFVTAPAERLVSAIYSDPELYLSINVTSAAPDSGPVNVIEIHNQDNRPSFRVTWDLKRQKSEYM